MGVRKSGKLQDPPAALNHSTNGVLNNYNNIKLKKVTKRRHFTMKKQKTDKGFSLIELIIVIAIMAVLVVVCAPCISNISIMQVLPETGPI